MSIGNILIEGVIYMFNIDQKDYIVRLSTGKVINFFYQNGSGIHFRVLNNNGSWSDPVIAVSDTLPSFSLCTCSDDSIYLIYQNTRGDILYSLYSGDNMSPASVLINKKSTESAVSKLFVKQVSGSVLFLYTVHQLNETILAFQLLNSKGELTRPSAVDYISGKNAFFCGVTDRNNDLYIFYKNKGRQKNAAGFRKYNSRDSKWEQFEPLIEFDGDYSLISADFDRHDNIHLLWQKRYPQKSELMYSLKHLGADVWDEKVLCKASDPFVNSSVLVLHDTVICFWVNKSGVFYCISKNNGINWKGVEKYNHDNTDEYCCIDYYSSDTSDNLQHPVVNVPGRYINGFELAFLSTAEQAAYNRIDNVLQTDILSKAPENISNLISIAENLEKRMNLLEVRLKQLEEGSLKRVEPQQTVKKDIPENVAINRVNSMPLMEGTCFKNITWDYIEGMGRNK